MRNATESDSLPAKFTAKEREAYRMLIDCGCTGWMVDLKTRKVRFVINDDIDGVATNLVALRHYFESGKWSGNIEPEATNAP